MIVAHEPTRSESAAARHGPPASAVDGPADPSPTHPTQMFGEGLAPVLVQACGGRLTDLHWFRTDWQRGGALTGYAVYRADDGEHPVVVKLPVRPIELLWLRRLQRDRHAHGEVVPHVLAGGDVLNGYDMVWVVMARLPHGPLGPLWHGAEFDLLAEAAGRFYAAAASYPVDAPPRTEDWPSILRRARQAVHEHSVPKEQRWNKALKGLQKASKTLLAKWDARPVDQWCHGDLHLANAMTRSPPPDGPAVLFDLAEVHAGHWVEDAVYFEHLFWGHESHLAGRDVVKMISRQRKAHGLAAESDWPRLANMRRALLAGAAPAYLASEGAGPHLHGALNVLERTLDQRHV
jgi:hypothetical protein